MAADRVRRVLTGDITTLPGKESNIVRIFTSSTFTDTFEERNRLMRDVYPSLRTYCQQHGLEFQVVDMRWGVRDEATADHKTSELCMSEIKNCQRLTPGPNFVCLLGNKYGYRPFPYRIKATEFEVLLEIAKSQVGTKEEIELILEWFLKDTNALPAEYVLQPITVKYKHFNDYSDESRDIQKQQRGEWWSTFESIQRLLKGAAKIAGSSGQLSTSEVHKYFMSVTEQEIQNGILNSTDPSAQSLCYIRHIEDIDVNLDDRKAGLYIDVQQPGIQDEEAQDLLDKLKRKRVLQRLGDSNVTHFNVPWKEGINSADRMHQEYLDTFCRKFESDIKRLVDKSLVASSAHELEESPLYRDVLHHAWFCKDKCSNFRGRQDILDRIEGFLKDDEQQKPLIIYGASGSGKTSIVAMVVSQIKEWLGSEAVGVFRFLGTSPDSSGILSTLASVCTQLCEVFALTQPGDDILEDYSQLVRYFHSLVNTVPVSAECRLVLMLDSVDQLSPSNNAHLMNWLPKTSPQHLKIIVSVLPGYYNILPTLRKALPSEKCYVEVPSLSLSTGEEILKAWLQNINRSLSVQQKEVVMEAFSRCPQPLFLKLLFTEACRWCSFTNIEGLSLGSSVSEAIGLLFERLEKKHGKTLVAHALGYISAARNGLTENELEDALSLDDDVIDDVYQYWDPPVEGVVRLPNLLWARIRHDIDEFLVERQADKKTVVTWYHRQFWEAAESRYLGTKDEKIARHSLLAAYFQGSWGGGKKKPIHLTKRKKTLPDGDRQVSSQPILFGKGVFNLRKLSELPYHLTHAGKFDVLDEELLFNFEWLYSKLQGESLNKLLVDYEKALEARTDVATSLVEDTIVLSASNLKHDVNSLAGQLTGRLLAFATHFKHIASLLSQAERWCHAQKDPVFVCRSACLISAGGPLKTNLRGHTQRINNVAITKDDKFIVTSGNDCLINVWNSDNHDLLHSIKMADKAGGTTCLALTHDDRCAAGSAGTKAGVWDLDTGEAICRVDNEDVVTCLALTDDAKTMVTGSKNHVIKVWDISTGELKHALSGHEGAINAVLLGKDRVLVSGSQDSTVRLWNMRSGESVGVLEGHSKPVLCLELSRDCQSVISGSEDKTLKIWGLQSRDCVTLKGHSGLVKCMAAMHDGKRVVSGSKDSQLKVWDLVTLECRITLKGHTDVIWSLAVACDDSFVVSASKDDMLRVWDPDTGDCLQTLLGHSSWASCVAIATDCQTIISGSNDKNLKLWNQSGSSYGTKLPVPSDHVIHHSTQPECVAITTGGKWGLTGAKNDALKIWDLKSARVVKSIKCSVACIVTAHASPLAITGSHDGLVQVWNCENGDCVNVLRGHEGTVTCLCVTEDDNRVISSASDGKLRVWNLNNGQLSTLENHSDAVTCCEILSDSCHVVSGSKDKTAKLWNINSGVCEQTYSGHTKGIGCVAVTKNAQTVVTGSEDFTLRVWDRAKGCSVLTLIGHNDTIKCIGITLDDRYAIAGSHEAKDQLRLWDLHSGDCVRILKGHSHAVMNLRMLHEDDMVVTSSRDGTIKVWGTKHWELFDSYDFQSQVKYFALSPAEDGYSVVTVTKSGTVGVLSLFLPAVWRIAGGKTCVEQDPEEKEKAKASNKTAVLSGADSNEEKEEGKCEETAHYEQKTCCSYCSCCNKCNVV